MAPPPGTPAWQSPPAAPAPQPVNAPAGTSAAPSPASQVPPTAGQVPPPPPPPPVSGGPSPVDEMAKAMSGLLGKMTRGEQLLLGGAAVILLITFLLFAVILNTFFGPSELAVAASVSLIAIVWLKAEGRYDIGANYRLIVVLLAVAIAVPVAMSLLYTFRILITPGGFSRYTGLELFTHLSYWIGGALAAVGSWWVWKGR